MSFFPYRAQQFLKRFLPQSSLPKPFKQHFINIDDPIAKRPFLMYLRQDGYIESELQSKGLYGGYEKESLKIWAILSKTSQVILDIGANTGAYSLIAQNNNQYAKIIAFEPIDVNLQVLSKNIRKNKFPISIENIALSNQDGIAKMFMLKDSLNYITSVNDDRYALHPEIKGNKEVIEVEVPIRTFRGIHDKYELQGVDLIKIDVEGHEVVVLESMLPYLSKYKPAVLIEVIGDQNAKELDAIFKTAGYKDYVSIDEVNKSRTVNELWDNKHHNFLICSPHITELLREKNLVR
jgi:FkbM family methyltransferase